MRIGRVREIWRYPVKSMAGERLSALVGRSVTLCPLRPAGDLAHYRRAPLDGPDPMRELRRLLGRLDDEPLPRVASARTCWSSRKTPATTLPRPPGAATGCGWGRR